MKAINTSMDTLSIGSRVKYDGDFCVVWVIKMAFYQLGNMLKGGNDKKKIKGVSEHLKTLHNCPLIKEFLNFYKDFNIPYIYLPDTRIDTLTIPVPITETETETETEEIVSSKKLSIPPPFKEIISYLNQKTGKNFDFKEKIYQGKIKARWKEGKRLPDFQKVVDIKVSKWSTDEEMMDFLRPETLFGTKMGSYLNETIDPRIPSYLRGCKEFLDHAEQESTEEDRKDQ